MSTCHTLLLYKICDSGDKIFLWRVPLKHPSEIRWEKAVRQILFEVNWAGWGPVLSTSSGSNHVTKQIH